VTKIVPGEAFKERGAKSGVRAPLLTDSRETAKVRKTPPLGFAHLERFLQHALEELIVGAHL
jgi:hypothetical protein